MDKIRDFTRLFSRLSGRYPILVGQTNLNMKLMCAMIDAMMCATDIFIKIRTIYLENI